MVVAPWRAVRLPNLGSGERTINDEAAPSSVLMSDQDLVPGSTGGRRLLTEEEREKMIATLHSMVFWVGVLIPEWELVGDREIELRETVFRLTTKDHLAEEDVRIIDDLVAQLKTREKALERRLVHDPMTVDAAKALMEEIRGLLKAMDDLRSAETDDHASVGRAEVMARVKDARRWKAFIEQIKPPR